jgi:hypothetical protein
MAKITEVAINAKESLSYVAMPTGAGMTLSPILVIQILGVIIGAAGLAVAVVRCLVASNQQKEMKRANDLNYEKWMHERRNDLK